MAVERAMKAPSNGENHNTSASIESNARPTGLQILEGCLYQKRKNRWKSRNVVLNLAEGTFSCFKPSALQMSLLVAEYSDGEEEEVKATRITKLHTFMTNKKGSKRRSSGETTDSIPADITDPTASCLKTRPGRQESTARFHIPASVPWRLVDVSNDDETFIVRIPAGYRQDITADDFDLPSTGNVNLFNMFKKKKKNDFFEDDENQHKNASFPVEGDRDDVEEAGGSDEETSTLVSGISAEGTKKGKVLHYYFRCPGGGNEKNLWIKACKATGRMYHKSKIYTGYTVLRTVQQFGPGCVTERTRTTKTSAAAEKNFTTARHLSVMPPSRQAVAQSKVLQVDENLSFEKGQTEYMVFPTNSYPHQWMTHEELNNEMLRTSLKFHDLRMPNSEGKREIGAFRVEVLSCAGLPKMDTFGTADAVCYLVVGSYAFTTDIIPNKLKPMWLRNTKRAAIFPVYHAFAQLFCGVFDDDGAGQDDDFIGRVVIDLCRLRPGTVYDVTLALRESSYMYTRRPRGAIRLRFRLDWKSEQDAVMSYIPGKDFVKRTLKQEPAMTIKCGDRKAFKNIVVTVHGSNLPGRYSKKSFRALQREWKLYKIFIKHALQVTMDDLMMWANPAMSFCVFAGWVSCTYWNSVALVPPYLVFCALLFLTRNYAYNISSNWNWGYNPLTFEEMLLALMFGSRGNSRHYMDPLSVNSTSGNQDKENHKPLGVNWFQLLGWMANTHEQFSSDSNDLPHYDHMEFPFSEGDKYQKIGLEDASKGASTQRSKKSLPDEEDDNENEEDDVFGHLMKLSLPSNMSGLSKEQKKRNKKAKGSEEEASLFLSQSTERSVDVGSLHGTTPRLERERGSTELIHSNVDESGGKKGTSKKYDATISECPTNPSQKKRPKKEVANQDAYVFVPPRTTLLEDFQEGRGIQQKMTLRAYDDRIAYLNKETAKEEHGLERDEELEKLIEEYNREVGFVAYKNPITRQKAIFLAPFMDIAKVNFAIVRTLVNLFLWKDPYLSFWGCIICIIWIMILLIFPWRLFLFLVGSAAFGPQNMYIRIKKEREDKENEEKVKEEATSTLCAAKQLDQKTASVPQKASSKNFGMKLFNQVSAPLKVLANLPLGKSDSFSLDSVSIYKSDSSRLVQPVILSHLRSQDDGFLEAQYREGGKHRDVVVPYSPLRPYRFYDWPPDPNVSRATPVPLAPSDPSVQHDDDEVADEKIVTFVLEKNASKESHLVDVNPEKKNK